MIDILSRPTAAYSSEMTWSTAKPESIKTPMLRAIAEMDGRDSGR
jgi:hypothetical protein